MPPASGRPGGARAALARTAAWLVLALVLWRALAGLARFGEELATTPLAERRLAWSGSFEERLARTNAAELALWRALAPHTAGAAWLHVSYAEDARGRELFRGLQRLRALLCPTVLKGLPFDARRPAASLPAGASGLVLDLDSGRVLETLGSVEELARGEGFRLVRVRAAEKGGG